MRPLFSLLVAGATVSAIGTSCGDHNIDDLVKQTTCGDSEAIPNCIKQVDAFRLEEISPCFISSGCEKDAAVWFMQKCMMLGSNQDLRKRAASTDKDTTTERSTAKPSANSKTASAAPSKTPASTTKDSSTSPTAMSTIETTAASTSSDSTTLDARSSTDESSSTTSFSSAKVCSTTKTITTSTCSTSGKKKTCSETTMPTATCAAGLLCFPAMGPDVCMKRDVPLTTSGIIVSIAFGMAVTGIIVWIIVMSVKARSKQEADKQKFEAMFVGMGKKHTKGDVESVRYKIGDGGVSESNIPLVTPGGPRSDQMEYQQEYNSQAVPQIQFREGNPHWSRDYYARR